MKTSLLLVHGSSVAALAVSMACLTAPAWAQDAQTVSILGEVDLMCTLGQPSQGTGALNNFDTPSGTVFGITHLTDPETLSTRAANITLTLDAMCNGIHRVVIASDNNGLWRNGAGAPQSGFGSAVPYTANLVWADQEYPLTAEAADRLAVEEQMLVGRPTTGEMLIEFSIGSGATNAGFGAPLLSGEYSDVLRITVESQ
jgi:hypothetical protein